MGWNNRVLQRKDKRYGIHEVYYREDDSIDGFTAESMCDTAETVEELERNLIGMQSQDDPPIHPEDIELMLAAFEDGVLDEEVLVREFPHRAVIFHLNQHLDHHRKLAEDERDPIMAGHLAREISYLEGELLLRREALNREDPGELVEQTALLVSRARVPSRLDEPVFAALLPALHEEICHADVWRETIDHLLSHGLRILVCVGPHAREYHHMIDAYLCQSSADQDDPRLSLVTTHDSGPFNDTIRFFFRCGAEGGQQGAFVALLNPEDRLEKQLIAAYGKYR